MDSLAWLHLTLAHLSTDGSLAPSETLPHSPEKTPHCRQHLVALSFLLGLLLVSNPAFALRQGDRGAEVAALQRQLQTSGYFAATNVTSYYGPITAEAVRRFQRARGLAVDGIAGPQTMAALGQPVLAAPAGGSSTNGSALRKTNRGSEVTVLQNQLQAAGYYNGPITGYFGSSTEAAVRRLQAAKGLTVDGIYGSSTRTTLLKALSGTQVQKSNAGSNTVGGSSSPSSKNLRRGSRGSRVSQLQQALKSRGYYGGVIDGIFGAQTEAALRAFQRSQRLAVDGIYGPNTQARLGAGASQGFDPQVSQGKSEGSTARRTAQKLSPSQVVAASRINYGNTLRKGNSGSAVTNLQELLKTARVYNGPVTGHFGELTRLSVRRFQNSKGLIPDGVVGPSTFNALIGQASSVSQRNSTAASAFNTIASQATKPGTQFTTLELQSRLKSRNIGCDPGFLDGIFGPRTEAAVRCAQEYYNVSRGRILAGQF